MRRTAYCLRSIVQRDCSCEVGKRADETRDDALSFETRKRQVASDTVYLKDAIVL